MSRVPQVPRRRTAQALATGTKIVPQANVGGFGRTPYTAGDRSSNETMISWNPSLRSADGEILNDRDTMVARSRDVVHNNGWAAGGVQKEVDAIVGESLRPLSKPNWRALGLSEEWAAGFKLEVEARWRAYSDDPRHYADVTRSQSVAGMFAIAYRSYLVDGDAIGVIGWMEDRPTRTVLRVMDTDLLSNPNDMPDDEFLRGGVEVDEYGAAIAYHFRQAHQGDTWASAEQYAWARVEREQAWGRPQVLHFFDKQRDGQSRGVSRFTSIIEKLRMEDNYSRVELQAAVINAVFAAFIKSPMDADAVAEMFAEGGEAGAYGNYSAQRGEYYAAKGDISMAGAKVPHLFPGEEIGTVPVARPAAQFGDFESAVLRNIASGLNISYEQLAADWSKTNYSSARAALVEVWRSWTARRKSFAHGFCQPFFMAWLEEQVDRGFITLPPGAPDFHENWPAYAQTKWIGPGKGFVDPVKEAVAAAMRVALGVSTLEDEAAELTGSDLAENQAQIAREIAAMPEGVLHPAQESFAKFLGTPDEETGAPANSAKRQKADQTRPDQTRPDQTRPVITPT